MFADRAGELDERFQPGAGRPRQPRVEPFGRLVLGQPVDVAQLAVEQERAVHRPVGGHDLGELEQLPGGLVGGVLQQRIARALDPLAGVAGGAAVLVVLGASDLVSSLTAELHDMEGVKGDLGVRQRLADRLLIAGGHVDRDCLDRRLLLVGQLVEEPLQGLGVATRRRPHDPRLDMVGDAGEELAVGAVRDLVDADEHKRIQTAVVKLVGDHPGEDRADRSPRDPHQPRDRGLVHLLGQERGHVLEVTRVRRARPGPRDPLIDIAAARAVQPPQQTFDEAPRAAEIEVTPALGPMLLDAEAARAAARAHRVLRLQGDGHDHPPRRRTRHRVPRHPEAQASG